MDEEKQVGIEKEAIRLGRLLLSCWWMILVAGILLALASLAYTDYNHVDVYQSTTKLYVQIEDKNNNTTTTTGANQRVEAYRIVLKSRTTLEDVIATIKQTYPNYSRSYGALNGMVATTVDGDTEIFTVTVTSQSKEEAYLVAKAIVSVMQVRVPSLFGQSAKVGVVDSPVISSTPVTPSYRRNAIIGFFVGAILACVVIVALDLLNDRLKSEDWLTQTYGGEIPVLASIPDTQHGSGSRGYRYYRSYRKYGYGYYYGYGYGNRRSGKK